MKLAVFTLAVWIISSNLANRKEMLMKEIERFRRPEQLQLFEPPKCLPVWKDLPTETRRRVTELLARMFKEHVRIRVVEANSRGGRDV